MVRSLIGNKREQADCAINKQWARYSNVKKTDILAIMHNFPVLYPRAFKVQKDLDCGSFFDIVRLSSIGLCIRKIVSTLLNMTVLWLSQNTRLIELICLKRPFWSSFEDFNQKNMINFNLFVCSLLTRCCSELSLALRIYLACLQFVNVELSNLLP